jgi:hypothetical protein
MGTTIATRIFAAMILIFGLSACVSPKYVVSDITRHHILPRTPSGESFVVVSSDEEQEESLAFEAYAGLISQRLSGLGLTLFRGESATPDLVVTLKWSVEGPSPDVKSRSTGAGVGFGYGFGYRKGPFGYGYGSPYESRTSTKQMYVRHVDLIIYDGMTYNTENPTRVFEGSAVSTGTNGQSDPVMPFIVQAIFDQFPGASGQTRTVRVEVPPDSEAVNTGQVNSRSAK